MESRERSQEMLDWPHPQVACEWFAAADRILHCAMEFSLQNSKKQIALCKIFLYLYIHCQAVHGPCALLLFYLMHTGSRGIATPAQQLWCAYLHDIHVFFLTSKKQLTPADLPGC